MDLENGQVPNLFSSTPSSAAEIAEDRLVEMELEAAEVLADLAHSAKRERGGAAAAGASRNWGCKGKRVAKRVKSESPPGRSGLNLNLADPVSGYSDPTNDQAESDQQQDQTASNDVIIKAVKAEQDAELLKPSSTYAAIYTSIGNGRRQNLTEAEKEERRLRRILANRESARQTIRRRQALCEELTKKAADLARENETLKEHKELALKDYQSLETLNKHLKAQMAKIIKPDIGQTPAEQKSIHVETSSPPASYPLQLYSHNPYQQLGWHSLVKPSNPIIQQNGLQNACCVPSKLESSQEQDNPNFSANRTPFYMVSCPWFFPVHDNASGLHNQPSFVTSMQNEMAMHNGCSSLSKAVDVKTEASGSSEGRVINDLNAPPVGYPPEGSNQASGTELNATAGGTFSIKHGNMPWCGNACSSESTSMKVNHVLNALPKRNQELVYQSRKLDAAAAAEARKRRKELTKIKNLHLRQCRIHH